MNLWLFFLIFFKKKLCRCLLIFFKKFDSNSVNKVSRIIWLLHQYKHTGIEHKIWLSQNIFKIGKPFSTFHYYWKIFVISILTIHLVLFCFFGKKLFCFLYFNDILWEWNRNKFEKKILHQILVVHWKNVFHRLHLLLLMIPNDA